MENLTANIEISVSRHVERFAVYPTTLVRFGEFFPENVRGCLSNQFRQTLFLLRGERELVREAESTTSNGHFVKVDATTTMCSCKSSKSTQLLHVCRRNGNVERCWDATIPTLHENFDGLFETSLTANRVIGCFIRAIKTDPELNLQSLNQLKRCASEKGSVGDNGCPHL
ncbi:MAG: hypothetical protein DDT34_02327 [Firmicutes bacterium]|nr:hypothetical protein [Bacillota bacterium]